MVEGLREFLGPFCKGTSPCGWGLHPHDLIISQRPNLKISPCWGLASTYELCGGEDTAYSIPPLITPKFMFFSHAKYIYCIPTPPKELTDSSINSRVWSPKLHLNLTLFKSPMSEIGREIHPEANSSPAVKWRDLASYVPQNTMVGHGQERHYHSNRSGNRKEESVTLSKPQT